MQTNTKADAAAEARGFLTHLGDFFRHLRRRFAPGQVEVDLFGGQILCNVRGAAKVERRSRLLLRREEQFRPAHVLVLAVESHGFTFHQFAPDVGELGGGFVAFGVVEEYPIAS